MDAKRSSTGNVKYWAVLGIFGFVFITLTFISSAGASVPGFTGLGDLPGSSFNSIARGVSADGSVVVGYGNSASGTEAFRWTAGGGMVGLGDLAGGDFGSNAYGVSADGSVVVGGSVSASGYETFRWTASGGMVGLGDIPGGSFGSVAYDISADSSVVVGMSLIDTAPSTAFRWTSGGGMVDLGSLPEGILFSEAYGVSADGSVVVGMTWSPGYQAFRWTSGGGMVGLGYLPGGSTYSQAEGVSADGSTVVGFSYYTPTGYEAFRWTADEGMVGLGNLFGGEIGSMARDVSADGSVVVGNAGLVFIWDAANGMRSLEDVLKDYGFDLTGWDLYDALGISDDGLTIVGYGRNPSGNNEAWIATLPPMGDADLDGYVDDDDLSLLLANWGTGTEWGEGDFKDDDVVNDADLSLLLTNWHAGDLPPTAQGSIPEPASAALLLLGFAGLIRRRWNT